MRDNLPSNGTTVTTITKSEFSDDNDFEQEEEQDEENAPDDGKTIRQPGFDRFLNERLTFQIFFRVLYKRGDKRGRSGANFGSTFTKNFQDTSSKKEVTRDFSALLVAKRRTQLDV